MAQDRLLERQMKLRGKLVGVRIGEFAVEEFESLLKVLGLHPKQYLGIGDPRHEDIEIVEMRLRQIDDHK
jgi:hypothetical protein